MALYKIIFLGLTVAGPEEEARLRQGLQKKFNLSPERAESLLQRVPIIVKKTESKEEVARYLRAFEEIGAKVKVEEEPTHLPLTMEQYTGPIMTCPQCGFVQPEAKECVKCGLVISKFKPFQEMPHGYEGQAQGISSEERILPPLGERGRDHRFLPENN